MVNTDKTKPPRRWRRKELAEYWRVSDRTVDRYRPKLGEPVYIGRTPTWSDEQRIAAERGDVSEAA